MEKDLYEILGVSKNADEKEIKKAYRKLVKKYHPDNAEKDKKEEYDDKMKEINAAYAILSNKEKKAKYDRGGFENLNGRDFEGFNFDINDIFGDIFGGIFGNGMGRGRTVNLSGSNVFVTVERNFSDIWNSEERKVMYNKHIVCSECEGTGAEKLEVCDECNGTGQILSENFINEGMIFRQSSICSKCRGTGKKIIEECKKCNGEGVIKKSEVIEISIPKGAINMDMRISNKGNIDHSNGNPGDLIVRIRTEIPKKYDIESNYPHILMHMDIPLTSAVLGGKKEFLYANGEKISINIPPGLRENQKLKVKNKGVPDPRGMQGDLYIIPHIQIPLSLSSDQKKLFEKLQNTGI